MRLGETFDMYHHSSRAPKRSNNKLENTCDTCQVSGSHKLNKTSKAAWIRSNLAITAATDQTPQSLANNSRFQFPLVPITFFVPSKQTLASKTATLKMGLRSAKISKSHGIVLFRLTLFLSCILLVLCLHTDQLLAKGQLVNDCKSTPSLRNGNISFANLMFPICYVLCLFCCASIILCVSEWTFAHYLPLAVFDFCLLLIGFDLVCRYLVFIQFLNLYSLYLSFGPVSRTTCPCGPFPFRL